jgi:hypothetical protein
MVILSLVSLEKEGRLNKMVSLIHCFRCGETITNYHGDGEDYDYGCKYCIDLPWGSFLKELL